MQNEIIKNNLENIYKVYKENSETIMTEESTKMSLILPFFQNLGYAIHNPKEFLSEYVADVGIKSGEKVDYCILINNNPEILIECKHHKEKNLDKHVGQLFRYFVVSPVKLGILTNGVEYRFYSDTQQINIMDKEPFYILRMDNIRAKDMEILNLFTRENYRIENIQKAIDLQEKFLKVNHEYDTKIKLFFENQEEYINRDYANLLFNLIFDRDIPIHDMEHIIAIMKEACKSAKNGILPISIQKPIIENKLDKEPSLTQFNSKVTLNLYEVIINRIDISFSKLEELENRKTGKKWNVTTWGNFLEIIVEDFIDNSVNKSILLTLDGLDSTSGWIREDYVENKLTTQKFKRIKNGLYLNLYGNASAMCQKLYKACIDCKDIMSSYYITLNKSSK